ncbi:MAG: hypothetical protein QOG28_307, partial [Trebonia sp.]|nr:hypothetical protein [Trebonia sp.]
MVRYGDQEQSSPGGGQYPLRIPQIPAARTPAKGDGAGGGNGAGQHIEARPGAVPRPDARLSSAAELRELAELSELLAELEG